MLIPAVWSPAQTNHSSRSRSSSTCVRSRSTVTKPHTNSRHAVNPMIDKTTMKAWNASQRLKLIAIAPRLVNKIRAPLNRWTVAQVATHARVARHQHSAHVCARPAGRAVGVCRLDRNWLIHSFHSEIIPHSAAPVRAQLKLLELQQVTRLLVHWWTYW